MKRYLSAVLVAALSVLSAFAQNIDPTVEITRSYDVDLGSIVKPEIPLTVDDSLHKFDVKFDYSIFNRPYQDLYEFNPYETVLLKTKQAARHPWVYIKAGYYYPVLASGEAYLQYTTKKGIYFDLFGSHDSHFGTVPETFYDLNRALNRIGGDFKYAWESGEMTIGARYDYDRNNYKSGESSLINYGRNTLDVELSLRSANKEKNSSYYDFTARYRNTKGFAARQAIDSTASLAENYFTFKGFVGASFDIHRVYVDMNIRYASYGPTKEYNTGIVEFSPMYELSLGRLHGKFGVKFGNKFGLNKVLEGTKASDGNDLVASSNVFLDIDARFTIAKDLLWMHLLAKGGNDLNNFSTLLGEMPYMTPASDIRFGSRPFDGSLAFESVICGRTSVNIIGGYTRYRNKAYFVPNVLAQSISSVPVAEQEPGLYDILAVYEDMDRWFFGAEAIWKSQDVTFGASYRYNNYKNEVRKVTEIPSHTIDTYLRYNFRQRIIASVECSWRSKSYGETYGAYEVPSLFNLDINLHYKINRYFAVYAKCGNVLDRRNQYMPLYVEPGRNIGGGVCITL